MTLFVDILPYLLTMQITPASPSSDLNTFIYFVFAGVATIGIEALRRWVKHRMDIWESKHPIRKGDSDGKSG